MEDVFEKSVRELTMYLKITKTIPSENEWNKYACIENLLSAHSIEYLYGIKFNKLCRKIIKIK